jgi:type VI protein secretion system component VasF
VSGRARPLQLERFERYDAGEAFFDRLRELLVLGWG